MKTGLSIPRPAGGRDSHFERDFLDAAERGAGSVGTGYRDAVMDRLTRAERQYGVDSYLDKGLRGLLAEVDEEALDVAGWGVLAALVTNDSITDDDTRVRIVILLQHIASLGVQTHQLVQQIGRLLD